MSGDRTADAALRAARARYADERVRRIRPDGMQQFAYLDPSVDPAAPPVAREPIDDRVDVVVIVTGIAGLVVGARLRQAGLGRIRLVDRAGGVGGTWYWNRYPGAQCDIESYVYMPLLDELGVVPTEKYAHQPEIERHLRH